MGEHFNELLKMLLGFFGIFFLLGAYIGFVYEKRK